MLNLKQIGKYRITDRNKISSKYNDNDGQWMRTLLKEDHILWETLNYRKYKLLRCWCQCYLAGLKGLLVGFRDDNGIVRRLQCFDTDDIVAYCKVIILLSCIIK